MRHIIKTIVFLTFIVGTIFADNDVHPDTAGIANLDQSQEYLFEIIKTRRTVRKFKSTHVPEVHLRLILDAARYAPTAGNQQPWKFLVVQNRERLDQLKSETLEWYLEALKQNRQLDDSALVKTELAVRGLLEDVLSAPIYIAVLVDSTSQYPNYVIYDGTLAAGYLMIAARALGYGTGFFTTFFPENRMKDFFEIPNNYRLHFSNRRIIRAQEKLTALVLNYKIFRLKSSE